MDVGINQIWSSALEVTVQGQSRVKTGQSLVQSLVQKNVSFGCTYGKEVVNFFQPNFTGKMLRAIWVNWANQNSVLVQGPFEKKAFFLTDFLLEVEVPAVPMGINLYWELMQGVILTIVDHGG